MHAIDHALARNSRVPLQISRTTVLGHVKFRLSGTIYNIYINKNTLGVKIVQGQSEAALQMGMCDQKL